MRHVACDMRLSLLTYLGYVRPVRLSFFFFNDTATTEIYTLSLHDALPISRARSVPEYLKLRFDEKTRGVNAISFACMTVFSSGISMYVMGLLLNQLLGWDFDTSVWLSAGIVLLYLLLGRVTSAILHGKLHVFLL